MLVEHYSLCQNYGPPPIFQYLTCVNHLRECKHYHRFPYDVYIPHWSLFLIHSLGYPNSYTEPSWYGLNKGICEENSPVKKTRDSPTYLSMAGVQNNTEKPGSCPSQIHHKLIGSSSLRDI